MKRLMFLVLLFLSSLFSEAQLRFGPMIKVGGDMMAIGAEVKNQHQLAIAFKGGIYSWYSHAVMGSITQDFKVFRQGRPMLGISVEYIHAINGLHSYDKGSIFYTNQSRAGDYIMPQLRFTSIESHFEDAISKKSTRTRGVLFCYLGYSYAIHRVEVAQVGQNIDPDGVDRIEHRLRSKVCFGVGMSVVFGSRQPKETYPFGS